MIKAEMISKIASETNFDKKDIETIIDSFIKQLQEAVSNGETLYIRGFGAFGSAVRAPKLCRNIAANTAVMVPTYIKPTFKPYREFMEKVNPELEFNQCNIKSESLCQ